MNSFFPQHRPIDLPEDMPPQLVVVIDTEEEFDWNADPDRQARGVTAMAHIGRVQGIFREYGICPCYVVDYPIVDQDESCAQLRQYVQQGECEIGAHLHPWVNPPVRETLSRSNMYPGNLPRDLECEKLQKLMVRIREQTGCDPVAYKAGRYGFGPNTAGILAELGFDIDLSVCPPLDARADGGPDYRRFDARPFWFGQGSRRILELPCTGAFVGWAGRWSVPVYGLAQKLRRLHGPGLLARTGAVDRLMLSPEGFSSAEHIKLTRALYRQGVRSFTWSFHSPSVVPGHTTYVRTDQDLEEFLGRFRRFFDFFFGELGGVASSPTRFRKLMETME